MNTKLSDNVGNTPLIPITIGEPFLAAVIWSGYLDEIIPRPNDPEKDLIANWTEETKVLVDFIAKSISWAITSVSVSEENV